MPNLNQGIENQLKLGSGLEIALDFQGWTPGGVTSDLVRDGQYEVLIMKAEPQAKKSGEGVVVRFIFKITGPSCEFRGKQLVTYHPIPQGDSQSSENQRKRFIHSLFYSIVSGVRPDSVDALKSAGVRKMTLASFEGKTAWVKVRENTDNNGRPVGEIQFYISKADFLGNPGPFGAADDVNISKAAADAVDPNPAAAAQAAAPAPAPAPAPAASGANPVDDLLSGP